MSNRRQPLLDRGARLRPCLALRGPAGGLERVGRGLVPAFGPEQMMREALGVLGEAVSVEPLNRLGNAAVERAPLILKEAAVGNLVRQRVLEGVFELGEE